MIDAGSEVDLRGFERVIGREVDIKEENAAGVWRVPLRFVSLSVIRCQPVQSGQIEGVN